MTNHQDDSGALRERNIAVLWSIVRCQHLYSGAIEADALMAAIAALSCPAIAPQGCGCAPYDAMGIHDFRCAYATPQATPAAVDDELLERLRALEEWEFNADCCNSQFPISMLRRTLADAIAALAAPPAEVKP